VGEDGLPRKGGVRVRSAIGAGPVGGAHCEADGTFRAAVLVDVPGDVMARLMRLHSDGTGDSNAEVIQRMLSALEAAARRMPAASTTIPALPSPIHDA